VFTAVLYLLTAVNCICVSVCRKQNRSYT